MKNIFLAMALMFAAARASAEYKTFESFGIPVLYSSAAVAVGTHAITGTLQDLTVYAAGGNVTFQLYVSSTVPPGGGYPSMGYNYVASSPTIVPSGQVYSQPMRGFAINPKVIITALAAGATAYVDLFYLKPRGPGYP